MTETIHLQGIGRVPAKPAQDFKSGEFMLWNYYGVGKVEGITKETEKYLTFRLCSPDVWNDWNNAVRSERRLKKTRLVGIVSRKDAKLLGKNSDWV